MKLDVIIYLDNIFIEISTMSDGYPTLIYNEHPYLLCKDFFDEIFGIKITNAEILQRNEDQDLVVYTNNNCFVRILDKLPLGTFVNSSEKGLKITIPLA